MKKEIKNSQRVIACPYCGDVKHTYAETDRNYCLTHVEPSMGCCGESSHHFEFGYETEDELILDSELEERNA